MPIFSRPDGRLAPDVAPYRRIMPFIMRTRNESAVYFRQQVDLEKTLPFIEAWNASGAPRITFFHLFLFGIIRVLQQRPRLNRFIAGSHIYERDGIWVSYSAKKSLSDDAPIVVLKRRFDPALDFRQMLQFLGEDLRRGRSDEKSHVDKELSLFLKLPAPVLRRGVRLLAWLDTWNLLPGSFIRDDPLYASFFIANLGSIKLDAAYHHLYEYGNIPVFAAIGRVQRVPVALDDGTVATRRVCEVKYTLDERVEDGLYCAAALDLLRTMVEDPAVHIAPLPQPGDADATGGTPSPARP